MADSSAPAFGSSAPNTTRATRAWTIAPDAHLAGLDRHVERRSGQPVVAELTGRGTDRHDLGVRRRIVRADRLVPAFPDHDSVDHDDGTDRDLAIALRDVRELQRAPHEPLVVSR